MRTDVLYCEGPGDIVAAYASWKAHEDFKNETSVTFSSQVFEFCAERGLSLHALSHGPRADLMADGLCIVENKPRLAIRLPKIGDHLSLLLYALRLVWLVLRIRPRVIVVCSGVVGWSLAPLLALTGAKIVPLLHNALWPVGFHRAGLRQALEDTTHRFFWRHCVWKTLVVSPALEAQVRHIAGTRQRDLVAGISVRHLRRRLRLTAAARANRSSRPGKLHPPARALRSPVTHPALSRGARRARADALNIYGRVRDGGCLGPALPAARHQLRRGTRDAHLPQRGHVGAAR
ncbi:MAG TPA: hypothetical protein VHY19_00710 [Steroidobacteraceae bacterium]|nr:hypothetical protein [Steroidobacteraceae bacterium]